MSTDGVSSGATRGRPRSDQVDQAILHAASSLLVERGLDAMTIEEVAARAGVGKSSIYRRWPSKAHLVHEAVFPTSDATALPNTGSLAGDVREMVSRTAAVLTSPAARAALPGLVGEMAADLSCGPAVEGDMDLRRATAEVDAAPIEGLRCRRIEATIE